MYLLKRCHDEFDIDRAKAIDTIRQVRREEKRREEKRRVVKRREEKGSEGIKAIKGYIWEEEGKDRSRLRGEEE